MYLPPDAYEAEIFSYAKAVGRLPSELEDEDLIRLRNYVGFITAVEIGISKKSKK